MVASRGVGVNPSEKYEVNVLGQVSSGQSLENSVFQSLRPHYELTYYQRDTKEIDVILDSRIALEVKETASKRDLQKLVARSRRSNLAEEYIVSLNWSKLNKVVLATDL